MTIVWSKTAVDDLKSLRAYIRQHNPRAAAGMARTILARVENLADFPAQGRPGRVPHTRELVIPDTPFLVVYTVAGTTIQIIAVLHAARKWPG
ncbi:MAG: type II toxin-antitoxin system RelE/ParE family toxin [Rhodospirillales bacterium]|nr:type II toxin-antitoxin system RelE/ParE family toxin [Rhodospirillales bacterium]MBI2584624.1 type II toxin-antitoxin system RelE/ParE family toxin [Rhodospirillales bacterium]